MTAIAKESSIHIKVGLDADKNPVKLSWQATDSGVDQEREVKAFMMSLWDVKENNSMRIDLWTSELMVEEMTTFMYQSLVSMADTFQRATNDAELAGDVRDFAAFFAKKAGLVK